jgi:hypothetical protein
MVLVVTALVLGFFFVRNMAAWANRGCTTRDAAILSVFEGSPNAFERCDYNPNPTP